MKSQFNCSLSSFAMDQPTANPSPFPSSSPTVHPFSGYEGVGPDGECTDANDLLYSYVQYSGVAAPKDCASRCIELGISNQIGLGSSMSDICRCYYDGTAPEVAVAEQTSQHNGSGPIAGVDDSPSWQCYRLVVSVLISGAFLRSPTIPHFTLH